MEKNPTVRDKQTLKLKKMKGLKNNYYRWHQSYNNELLH